MREDEMRSVLIYGKEGSVLMEDLSSLQSWTLEPLGIEGGHEYCLSDGKVRISLRVEAPNVISTVNVLPHDIDGDQVAANLALKKLSDDLENADISNVITASDKDLA